MTRLRLEVSGAIFEYLVPSEERFGSKTPDHVNKPLGRATTSDLKGDYIMRDFFFQIVMFIAGIVSGVAVPLLPKSSQKKAAGMLVDRAREACGLAGESISNDGGDGGQDGGSIYYAIPEGGSSFGFGNVLLLAGGISLLGVAFAGSINNIAKAVPSADETPTYCPRLTGADISSFDMGDIPEGSALLTNQEVGSAISMKQYEVSPGAWTQFLSDVDTGSADCSFADLDGQGHTSVGIPNQAAPDEIRVIMTDGGQTLAYSFNAMRFAYLPMIARNHPRPLVPPEHFVPESFIFPYDLADIVDQRAGISGADQFITYHITDRPDIDDPCGRHPGDVLVALGVYPQRPSEFEFTVAMPYDGELVHRWITESDGPDRGGDIGMTFYVGEMGGDQYYFDIYHTDVSDLVEGDIVQRGQVIALLNRPKYNTYWVSVIHITGLVNGQDFMSTETIDISPYAIPPTLKAAHAISETIEMIYEGPNYCNMNTDQMIAAMLDRYLPNAGFCVDGGAVNYCGDDPRFQGLSFTQETFDERSIILIPN